MKKFLILLSVVVFVGFVLNGYFLYKINEKFTYKLEDKISASTYSISSVDDLTQVLLDMENVIYKNEENLHNPLHFPGYAHRYIYDQVFAQIVARMSYSCDSHTHFMTPVCESEFAEAMYEDGRGGLSGIFNGVYSDGKEGTPMIKDKYINQRISEYLYRTLLDQDIEFNKEHEKIECQYSNNWEEKNKETQLGCAHRIAFSENNKMPLEKALQIKSTPITEYLQRNSRLYSRKRGYKYN